MATLHFRTTDGIILTYDDTKYVHNKYSSYESLDGNSPSSEFVRIADSVPVIRMYAGYGTEFLDVTGFVTGTFLGMPRIILP